MKKNAIIVNTARKEVINEDEIIKLMEKRNDIKYVTDLTPDKDNIFKEKFKWRYFAAEKGNYMRNAIIP